MCDTQLCKEIKIQNKATYLPIRISKVLTVPSTLPPIISVFVKQTDITLSVNVSIICRLSTAMKKQVNYKQLKKSNKKKKRKKSNNKANLNGFIAVRPAVPSTQGLIKTCRDHNR